MRECNRDNYANDGKGDTHLTDRLRAEWISIMHRVVTSVRVRIVTLRHLLLRPIEIWREEAPGVRIIEPGTQVVDTQLRYVVFTGEAQRAGCVLRAEGSLTIRAVGVVADDRAVGRGHEAN